MPWKVLDKRRNENTISKGIEMNKGKATSTSIVSLS